MTRKTKIIITIIALSYVATWIGGYLSHMDALITFANKQYYGVDDFHERLAKAAQVSPDEIHKPELLKEGPIVKINWCVPFLPFVLIADSEYCIGPLWARGGTKIIIWYILGSTTISLSNWVS